MSYLESLPAARRKAVLRLAGATSSGPTLPAPAPPAQAAIGARELAHLRASACAHAAENDSLRRNLDQLVQRCKQLDEELQALRITSRAREGRAEQRHAAELAEAEAARCSQRRALLDLARTAQGLAQENAALNARLVALQDENEDSSRSQDAMRERMARLQAVCLQLEEQQQQQAGSPRGGAAGSQPQQQTELLDKLSATLCALGPSNGADSAIGVRDAAGRLPPALAPAKVGAAVKGLPTDLRLALRELEATRRERDGLAGRLKATLAQVDRLQAERRDLQQGLARERHAAGATTAELQRQLKAARDRVASMAERLKLKEAALEEQAAYLAKLERRLLQRGPTPAAPLAPGCEGKHSGVPRPSGGSRRASARELAERRGSFLPHHAAAGQQPWGAQVEEAGAEGSPGPSLAALSPDPCCSLASPTARAPAPAHAQPQRQRWPGAEQALADLLLEAEEAAGGAAAQQRYEQQERGLSPGADSSIATSPAHSDWAEAEQAQQEQEQQQDLVPRRLHWAADVAQQQDCAVYEGLQAGDCDVGGSPDRGYCAYQLGSPSPLREQADGGGAGACPPSTDAPLPPRGWAAAGPREQWGWRPAGQARQAGCNPLYGDPPAQADAAPPAAALAAPEGDRRSSLYSNDLFAEQRSPGQRQPGRQQVQRLAAHRQQQRQQRRQGPAVGGEPLPSAQPAAAGLPPRIPSVEFPSVSALLEALTPAAPAAAATAAAPPNAAEQTPAPAARQQQQQANPATHDAIEDKLQAAVASFFAETAQKAPPPGSATQQGGRGQRSSGGRAAGGRDGGGRGSLASAGGRGSLLGDAAAVREPVLKQGRPNRAADQTPSKRRGAYARR